MEHHKIMTEEEAEALDSYFTEHTVMPKPGKPGVLTRMGLLSGELDPDVSELLGVMYEDALADYKLGIIAESEMREYDRACLIPGVPQISFSADDVPVRRPSPIAARSVRK